MYNRTSRWEVRLLFNDLYVIGKNGFCFFHKSFKKKEKEIDDDLFSAFFNAIFKFSQDIYSEDYLKFFNHIEFKDQRFIALEHGELFFIALIDTQFSLIHANKRLTMFKNAFINRFRDEIGCFENTSQFKESEELFNKVLLSDNIILTSPDFFSEIERILREFTFQNPEITSTYYFSMTGVPYISINMERSVLNAAIREIEVRWQTNTTEIEKIFLTLGKNELMTLEKISNRYILVSKFAVNTSLGVADMYSDDCAQKIKQLIHK